MSSSEASAPATSPALRPLRWLAARVAGITGWRRTAFAAFVGAGSALAMPPWHAVPLLLVGFVALTWLLDGAARSTRPLRAGALAGFWFAFGYFLFGIHWIAEAFLVDPVRHGWMIPFALGGLSALLALFPAAACMASVWTCRRLRISGAGRVFVLAVCWVAFEWLRSWFLTGFPWNLIGYAWAFSPPMMQLAALAGVYGLSLVTLIVAAMPAVLADRRIARSSLGALAFAGLLLPLIFGGGWLRLQSAPSYDAAVPDAAIVDGVRLRLVQAGIPQRLKWRADLRNGHLMRHIALSRGDKGRATAAAGDGATSPTLVIWPETAVPFFLVNDPAIREVAATAVPANGLLMTGTVRYDGAAGAARQYRNSAVALNAAGDILAVYDKTHLVPFGEYVPLGNILPLDKIVVGAGDFVAGRGVRQLELPGLPPVVPLICYEAIFPAAVTASGARPGWLLNMTNDAWFGTRAGPQQHLAIAATRAVEEGVALVRAAGTGISAVVDPYGRVLDRLGVGEIGVLDSALPRPLAPTPYARFGNATVLLGVALCLAGAFVCRIRPPDGSSGGNSR